MDCQPVETPAPAVPRGDQRTGQDTIELSDQQRLGVGGQQSGQERNRDKTYAPLKVWFRFSAIKKCVWISHRSNPLVFFGCWI